MSVLKKSLLATTLAAALVGLSATAIAQGMAPELVAQHTAQRMSDAHGPHMHGARHASMPERMERMQRHRSDRLAGLKEALKITPEQEAAWLAFVARTGPAQAGDKTTAPRMSREQWRQLTTPERLDRMAAMKAERDAAMAKRMDATRSFYASLSPEQQKVFDQRGMGTGKGRHGGMGGHHGKHGGHHHGGHGYMKSGMKNGMQGGMQDGKPCDRPGQPRS